MDMETVITGPLPLRDSNYVILDAAQCAAIYQRVVEIGFEVGETPRDLLNLRGTQPCARTRQLYYFDPSRLFDLFDEVVIDPHFMLEYLYLRDKQGGRTLFYTRKRFVAPFIRSAQIYHQLFCGISRPYLHHIKFSFSPRGVFQFLLFVDTIERLYIDTGSAEWNTQLVFFNPQRDQLLQQCEIEWPDEFKSAFMSLDLRPRIQMTAEYAVVQVYAFSVEKGVAEIEYRVDTSGRRVEQLSCEQVIDLQTVGLAAGSGLGQAGRSPGSTSDSNEASDPSYPTSAAVLQ